MVTIPPCLLWSVSKSHHAILGDTVSVSRFQWTQQSLTYILRFQRKTEQNQPGSKASPPLVCGQEGADSPSLNMQGYRPERPVGSAAVSAWAAPRGLAGHGLASLEGPLETRGPTPQLPKRRTEEQSRDAGGSSCLLWAAVRVEATGRK